MLMGGCISINENSFSINVKALYFGINIHKPFLLLWSNCFFNWKFFLFFPFFPKYKKED